VQRGCGPSCCRMPTIHSSVSPFFLAPLTSSPLSSIQCPLPHCLGLLHFYLAWSTIYFLHSIEDPFGDSHLPPTHQRTLFFFSSISSGLSSFPASFFRVPILCHIFSTDRETRPLALPFAPHLLRDIILFSHRTILSHFHFSPFFTLSLPPQALVCLISNVPHDQCKLLPESSSKTLKR
jgi:hypothetical protein